MGTRFVKLLKILIKIGIMGLVMTGLILINKYISNANGSEKEGRKPSLERVVKPGIIIYNQKGS
jgi:hypothetical protein